MYVREDFNVSRRNFRKKMRCLSVASSHFLGNEPLGNIKAEALNERFIFLRIRKLPLIFLNLLGNEPLET